MKAINVKVIPHARKNEVSEEEGRLRVRVTAPAVGGKANKAAINVLADYFKVRKRDLRIIKGRKSRQKVIEILSVAKATAKE